MKSKGETVSIKKVIDDSGIPLGLVSTTFRRVANKQIGITAVKPTEVIEQAKVGIQSLPQLARAQTMLTNVPGFFSGTLNQIPAANRTAASVKQPVIPVESIDTSAAFRAQFDIKQVLTDKLNGILVFNPGTHEGSGRF